MKKSLIVSVIASISIVGLSTGVASAWHYNMSGKGVCQTDGSYKITWTVDNTSEPTKLEVKKSSNTNVIKVGETIPAREKENFYQVVDGTKPGTFKLELTADWKEDRNNMKRSATVTLNQPCDQPEVPETPTTPEEPGRGGDVLGEQVVVTPVGAVNAGEGKDSANVAAIAGVLVAALAIAYGIVRSLKSRA